MKQTKLFLISILFIISNLYASSNNFYTLISDYELKMDDAVKAWLNKNYGKSLDSFKKAKELLAKSTFASSEGFELEGCQALQTYTLVLARMAESEMYEANGQNTLSREVARQSKVWADKLILHGKTWYKIQLIDEKEIQFRQKWLSRFRSVILRSKNLKEKK